MIDATTIRGDAFARMPGYTEVSAAIERAREPLLDLRPTSPRDYEHLYAEAVRAAIATLKAGGAFPSDIAAELFRGNTSAEENTVRSRMHNEILGTLANERQQILRRGTDPALEHLDQVLDDIVEQVIKIAPTVAGVRSEEEANRIGKRAETAWQKLVLLTDSYNVLRETQVELSAHKIPHGVKQLIAKTGIFRDSIDHVSYWIQRRAAAAARSTPSEFSTAATATVDWLKNREPSFEFDTGEVPSAAELSNRVQPIIRRPGTATPAPTPRKKPIEPWWPTHDQVVHLIEASTHRLLWVPTTGLLQAAHEAATTATTDINTEVTEQQEDARREYFRLISLDDPTGIPTEHRVPVREEAIDIWDRSASEAKALDKRLKAERARAARAAYRRA